MKIHQSSLRHCTIYKVEVLLSRTREGWFMMKLDVYYCDKDARHNKKKHNLKEIEQGFIKCLMI